MTFWKLNLIRPEINFSNVNCKAQLKRGMNGTCMSAKADQNLFSPNKEKKRRQSITNKNYQKGLAIVDIHIYNYCLSVWYSFILSKPGSLKKPEVHIISFRESNLFILGLVCYFCPISQKNQHFDCPL